MGASCCCVESENEVAVAHDELQAAINAAGGAGDYETAELAQAKLFNVDPSTQVAVAALTAELCLAGPVVGQDTKVANPGLGAAISRSVPEDAAPGDGSPAESLPAGPPSSLGKVDFREDASPLQQTMSTRDAVAAANRERQSKPPPRPSDPFMLPGGRRAATKAEQEFDSRRHRDEATQELDEDQDEPIWFERKPSELSAMSI
mmetsp:Transcript_46865/g.121356  ORF Transcript_46865/g.121356 Transcript_46865/m.121356 type:complete len:204 (-) Transcript_46865:309-920(-)